MNPRQTVKTKRGNRIQAGIPSGRVSGFPDSARGLKIRGVVIATYVAEDPNHPFPDRDGAQQVYCDVLSYSSVSGFRYRIIPKCLVKQERGGAYSGRIWKPRAATVDLADGTLDLKYSNPANLNGDHVLVGFMDDSFSLPVIEGSIGHPSVDPGTNPEKNIGNRLNLKLEDGDPDLWKHQGIYHGVDADGNYVIDTTFANNGELQDDGSEPDPPTDGKGSVICRLPQDSKWSVQLMDMSDPLNPVPVLIKEMTKDGNTDLYGENYVYEIVIADLSDPENPDPKATLRLTKDTFEIELQDATKHFIVKPDLIELGAEGAADKAVLDSLLQDELSRIHDDIQTLADEFGDHVHPLPDFVVPLIPISTSPTIPGSTPAPPSMKPTVPPTGASDPGTTNSELVTIDS